MSEQNASEEDCIVDTYVSVWKAQAGLVNSPKVPIFLEDNNYDAFVNILLTKIPQKYFVKPFQRTVKTEM